MANLMAELTEWKVPASAQPRVEDYGYDLERALTSIVGLHSIIPPDAFTAQTLGDERAGNGVFLGNGLILTVGYIYVWRKGLLDWGPAVVRRTRGQAERKAA